jgi:thymidine phosphorylase
MHTRAVGVAVVELGGGRRRASDAIDPAVGLSQVRPLGTRVARGEPLLRVHAARKADAQAACERLLAAITIGDAPPPATPVVIDRIAAG